MSFKNEFKEQFIPFVIYADFESITTKVDKKKGENTNIYQEHKGCGYSYLVVGPGEPSAPVVYRGLNPAKHFLFALLNEK